jgi:cold shock CspA family protein
MAKRAFPQDIRHREHDNRVRHTNPAWTGTTVASVGTYTAELESVLTLQCAFMEDHEIAVSVIENSRDDKKFVVEEVDGQGRWVGRNHFFVDIFDAVDFYGMRLKQGVLPRDSAIEQYHHSKKHRSKADYTSFPDHGGRNGEYNCEMPRDSQYVEKKVVSYGDVEMWNVVGRYGFVRDDKSKKTIFFHATHKHQDTWMPMRGDAVQYRIGFDEQKNRLSAFDIDLRYTVAPKDLAVDSNIWQIYLDKFYDTMRRHSYN